MIKKKQTYESPSITETRVELESSICSCSVDITARSPTGGADIEAQTVNSDFGRNNDFTNDRWNE